MAWALVEDGAVRWIMDAPPSVLALRGLLYGILTAGIASVVALTSGTQNLNGSGGAGGGGSSFAVNTATGVAHTQGASSGNGVAVLTWS